jgi:Uma2 family endonuclease
MALHAFEHLMTEEEYLAFEDGSEVRHEYLGGYVHAMVGGTRAHNGIAGNLFVALKQQLKGGPCQVFMNDIKVRVEKEKSYYYPDVAVTCDPREAKRDRGLVLEYPNLIVEVLSLTTQKTDEREKWRAYQTLDSLKEYLLLDYRRIRATIHRRAQVGWIRVELDEHDYLSLDSADFSAPLKEIYEGVELPENPEED